MSCEVVPACFKTFGLKANGLRFWFMSHFSKFQYSLESLDGVCRQIHHFHSNYRRKQYAGLIFPATFDQPSATCKWSGSAKLSLTVSGCQVVTDQSVSQVRLGPYSLHLTLSAGFSHPKCPKWSTGVWSAKCQQNHCRDSVVYFCIKRKKFGELRLLSICCVLIKN